MTNIKESDKQAREQTALFFNCESITDTFNKQQHQTTIFNMYGCNE